MPRPSTTARETRETQGPQQDHRTVPFRQRGFTPAQRAGENAPREVFQDHGGGDEEERVEVEIGPGRRPMSEIPPRGMVQPVTKNGYPDRRFKGQRDLPPPEDRQDFTRARQGGVIGDTHVTIDGKPDRRFKENRSLSEDEAHRQWVQNLQQQLGNGRGGQRRQ